MAKKTYVLVGALGGPCQCDTHNADWHLKPYTEPASHWYKTWRFGQGDEPTIVDEKLAVCVDCLNDIRENEAEAAAEARAS